MALGSLQRNSMPLLPYQGLHSPPWRPHRLLTRSPRIFFTVVFAAVALFFLVTLFYASDSAKIYFAAPWSFNVQRSSVASVASSISIPTHTISAEPDKLQTSLSKAEGASPPEVELIHGNDLEQLREMVSQTKGYFSRDFSLGLGWNNVRYIIEAALIQARILNRTAILPSFIYARSCEYNIAVCADHAVMVNRGDAIGLDEWRNLPVEEQMGWKIPITLMLNVTHLRRSQPVLLVSEYLRLHNISIDAEATNGAWDRSAYHSSAETSDELGRKPNLFVIENGWFDPKGTNRVDMIPQEVKSRGSWHPDGGNAGIGQRGAWRDSRKTKAYLQLEAALPEGQYVLGWDEARAALLADESFQGESITASDIAHTPQAPKTAPLWDVSSDEKLENVLRLNGWEVLHTFRGAGGLDYSMTVVDPIRQVAPRDSLRGFLDDFGDVTADVVLLAGETHLGRKPGNLRFTSTSGRDNFARAVLRAIHPTDKVLNLAKRLDERMTEGNGGRLWMGAHMRRGDFVQIGWAMEGSLEAHLDRVKSHLDAGREVLYSITEYNIQTYKIPDANLDYFILGFEPPQTDYQFYLATDERQPENLQYLANHGAVLIYDLLTIEDRQDFGWPLMLTDVLAVVEQATLARASYFYGHALSSVSGGIVNMRAARGADQRTAVLD